MYKTKQCLKKIYNCAGKKLSYLSFRYIRISFYLFISIFILLIICVIISNNAKYELLTSILSNISAGLLTGMILLLIPNVKTINKLKIEKTIDFYKNTIDRINLFEKTFKKINWINMDNENYDTLYDAICCANNINVYIQQDQFINQLSLNLFGVFKTKFKYDASLESEKCSNIRDLIMEMGFADFDFKKLRNEFSNQRETINKLEINLRNEIKNNNTKIELINKSLI